MRSRFEPRYEVNLKLPAKIPIVSPGKFTSTLAPSVLTLHELVWNFASALRISSGFRGNPYTRPTGPGGTDPLLAAGSLCVAGPGCACPRAGPPARAGAGSGTPGMTNGASQNAYHLFFSITSGVMSTPRLINGAPCWVVMRRTPVLT